MTDKVIAIHGYKVRPGDPEHDPKKLFKLWSAMMNRPVHGVSWNSQPTWWEAVKSGRWNTYRVAWDKTEFVSEIAKSVAESYGEPVDVLAHSLGTRVALKAIDAGAPVRRVLLLNGADRTKHARKVAEARPDVEFFNVIVRSDNVLRRMGAWFFPGAIRGNVIGNKGIQGLPNWFDLPINDDRFQALASEVGYEVEGDNPESWFDHWYSYENENNWPLWRAILQPGPVPGFLFPAKER